MAVSTLSVHLLCLLCLLCLIPASDERPSGQHHARFHSTHDMKDVIFQEDLLKELKSSRVRCASQCHMLPKCKSYFYNKSARMCRLHSRVFTDTTGAIPKQGWGYYGRHATSVKRNKAKTTTNTPGLESSTLNPEQTTEVSTTAGITEFPSGDAATGTTQFPVKEVSEDARSPTTTGERTLTNAGPRTNPRDTSTERSRLLSTLTTKYMSQALSSTEKGGNLKNTLRSRMVTKPFVKLWAVTPESVPPGKVASISSTDSLSTTEEGAESMSTHVTETGSRVTIRRTTSNVMTPTSTTSTTPTWTTRRTTERDTTPNQNDKQLTDETPSASGNRSQADNALNTSSYIDDSTETDSSMSIIPEETTVGHASQETPTSHHNEDQHDQLNFLTTEDEAKFFELSTGMVMPSVTFGDDDDEQGAITVMIIGDDDNDGDDTTQFIMEPDLETTMSVISIGGDDDVLHEHILDPDSDDDVLHEHILDPDSDDDGGEFPFTTDIAAFTREHGVQQDRSPGRKTTEVMQRSSYATLQLDKSVTNTGSTESPTSTGSSVAGKVAAYVVVGVVAPLLGVAGYALYRRWRTGPWTPLHKQEDGLGLQLVSST